MAAPGVAHVAQVAPDAAHAAPLVIATRLGVFMSLSPTQRELDAATIDALHARIGESIEERCLRVVLDLRAVQLLGGSGLEALLDAQDRLVARGGALRVSNVSPLVRTTLRLTGIDDRVRIADDPPEARSGPPVAVRTRLGEMLVARGAITPERLAEVLASQQHGKTRLGELLVERGAIRQQDLLEVLAEQLGIEFTRLKPGLTDPLAVRELPRTVAERLTVVPMFRVRDTVTVATCDAQSMPSINEVEERLGARVRCVFATREDILRAIAEGWESNRFASEFVTELDDDFEHVEQYVPDDAATIDDIAGESPVVNTVNAIIQRAIREGASDIHLEAGVGRSRVRMRVDGVLYEIMAPKADMHPAMVSRLKVMANLDIAERRLPQDGRIQVNTQGRRVDLRFSSLPGLNGEKVVLRILDKAAAILDLDQLGMSAAVLGTFRGLLSRSYGLVLATGPTGSGKTTTLYAALNHLNSIERSIVTIEDPVEYQLDVVNQNEVRPAVGLTFARTLKHVLRQDPDIIMVGEIRERETAEIAVQAALTGHLVLSTLHTNDSIGAVTRLVEMGIEPYLLSSALIGVVAQRLVRTICPGCATTYVAPDTLVERFGWDAQARIQLARGKGCTACFDSGYRGRMAIHELLEVDEALERLIIGNPAREALQRHLREREVESLFDCGLQAALARRTSIEEVMRVVNTR